MYIGKLSRNPPIYIHYDLLFLPAIEKFSSFYEPTKTDYLLCLAAKAVGVSPNAFLNAFVKYG